MYSKRYRDLVAVIVPITDKEIEFCFRFREWNRDDVAVVDTNWSIPSSSLLEIDAGEVKEAANLVLGLEHISPVCTGFDRAVCP